MGDQVKIQLIFRQDVQINGSTIPYQDAFYFTQEEYATLTPERLQAMKDERVANWVSAIENPIEPTPEQLQEQQDQIQAQIDQLQDPIYIQKQVDELSQQLDRVSETLFSVQAEKVDLGGAKTLGIKG